jgi:hypothetical protein
MQTKLIRIDMSTLPAPTATTPNPLENLINNASTDQNNAGFKLITSFVVGANLMLIFQK